MKAALPDNEQQRLEKLKSLGLLDTEFEEFFDSITRVAAFIMNVPIALMSLIDHDRQWFKSRHGISFSETPRDIAFCAHALLNKQPLIVEDATQDQRFSDNPAVTGEAHVRFYVGIPILSLEGYVLGTLCAVDTHPRKLVASELDALQDLARLISNEIQNRERAHLSSTLISHSQSRFENIFNNAAIGIGLVCLDGQWQQVNDELCRIVGYPRHELLSLTFQQITHPEDLERDLNLLHDLYIGRINRYQLEKRYIRKDGRVIWIELNVSKQICEEGLIEYYIAIIEDITTTKDNELSLLNLRNTLEEQVQQRTHELRVANIALSNVLNQKIETEQSLKNKEKELKAILLNANDAYLTMDSHGLITEWNHQAEETFGWKRHEAIGKLLHTLIIPSEHHQAHAAGMQRYIESNQSAVIGKRIEVEAMRKDGTRLPVELFINALSINNTLIFSSFLRDISEKKALEKILHHEARNDIVTGLANRRKFEELLPEALAFAHRQRHIAALLFLDLDGFKSINDRFGHEAGDSVLKETGLRLEASVRSSDTVARLAGDEFVAILDGISHVQNVQRIAEKILERLAQPIHLHDQTIKISASIGAAIYDGRLRQQPDHQSLLKQADLAMYQAKEAGKNRYVIVEMPLVAPSASPDEPLPETSHHSPSDTATHAR